MSTHQERDLDWNQVLAWYVLQVYPESELQVKNRMKEALLEKNKTQPGMQIIAPIDILVEAHEAEKLKGFIVVKMVMQPEVWKIISNISGVMGYIGMGVEPLAFHTEDWSQIKFPPRS